MALADHPFLENPNIRYKNSCAKCARIPEVHPPAPEKTTFETWGRYIDFANPLPEQVYLADIARSLSHTPRFVGHTERFYPIAEHAIFVYEMVLEAGHPELGLPALHHDSHETYTNDIPTPLKRLLGPKLVEVQTALDGAIAKRFGFDPALFDHPVVKEADRVAMRREAAALKPSRGTGDHWGYAEPLEPIHDRRWSMFTTACMFVEAHEDAWHS